MIATEELTQQQAIRKYTGFGAPDEFNAHIFTVTIPPGMAGNVVIRECYGYLAGIDGYPDHDERANLPRPKWKLVADTSRKDFNARLRAKKVTAGSWKPHENKIDRMLGKELCVLAWAVEHASTADEIEVICRKWSALRPEERWWLYTMTAAEGGMATDNGRGWRKALHLALSDGNPQPKRIKKSLEPDPRNPSLFDAPKP